MAIAFGSHSCRSRLIIQVELQPRAQAGGRNRMRNSAMNATDIPTALVSFPSIVGTSNAAIVKWVRVFLEDFGITVHGLPCPEGDRAISSPPSAAPASPTNTHGQANFPHASP
jgi:hypothetical protein